MKGPYSEPEDKLDLITQSLLYPDNPYHFDFGGNLADILTLAQEEFVAFKTYMNAMLFITGDDSDVYHALSTAD